MMISWQKTNVWIIKRLEENNQKLEYDMISLEKLIINFDFYFVPFFILYLKSVLFFMYVMPTYG